MGEKEDLFCGEIFCPSSNEWTKMNKPMAEVNGWCSACLGEIQLVFLTRIVNAVDKPIRMMLDEREVTRSGTGENLVKTRSTEDQTRLGPQMTTEN